MGDAKTFGRSSKGSGDDVQSQSVIDLTRSTRALLVYEPFDALLLVTATPPDNRGARKTEPISDFSVRQALRRQRHDARSLGEASFDR